MLSNLYVRWAMTRPFTVPGSSSRDKACALTAEDFVGPSVKESSTDPNRPNSVDASNRRRSLYGPTGSLACSLIVRWKNTLPLLADCIVFNFTRADLDARLEKAAVQAVARGQPAYCKLTRQ